MNINLYDNEVELLINAIECKIATIIKGVNLSFVTDNTLNELNKLKCLKNKLENQLTNHKDNDYFSYIMLFKSELDRIISTTGKNIDSCLVTESTLTHLLYEDGKYITYFNDCIPTLFGIELIEVEYLEYGKFFHFFEKGGR